MLGRILQYRQVLLNYYLPLWTQWFRCLPDFIIVGVQKGGTTSLYALLEKSPDVKMGRGKEIWFFDKYYHKGINWYRLHFPFRWIRILRPHIKLGEATPSYIFNPSAIERIRERLPTVKIVILLRDPVARAFSHYKHMRRYGRESAATFEYAIELESSRVHGEIEKMGRSDNYYSQVREDFSYVEKGMYITQLRHIYSLFDRDQVLVVKSEV